MFKTTSNQVIKIHKGDDSGIIKLSINMGTRLQPIQYRFYPDLSIYYCPDTLIMQLDKAKFHSKASNDGFYDFEYNYLLDSHGSKVGDLGWYLNKELVDLSDYGISYSGTPDIPSHIVIARFKDHPSEVYFYILNVNDDIDQWIIKKTFYSIGEVTTEFARCDYGTLFENNDVVTSDNNMNLYLSSEDTIGLRTGEYSYQIRAKLYFPDKDEYVINTISNRFPLYVIDGEDSQVW